jgi:tetratricopeptide (TPR) repeat protein
MKRRLFTLTFLLSITTTLFGQSYTYWVNQSKKSIENGDYIDAITDCDKALAANSKGLEALSNRGVAKRGLGQYESALADLDAAVAIDANSAAVFTNRGMVKNDLGYYRGAMDDFNTSIAIDPNNPNNYYGRGYAYYKIGKSKANFRNAIADYDMAVRLGAGNYQPKFKYWDEAFAAISRMPHN